MMAIWGKEGDDWVGQSMTLYRDPDVKLMGDVVGGIRISHMTGLNREKLVPITKTRGKKFGWLVKPLTMQDQAPQISPERVENILEDARFAARKGGDAFKAWWTGPGKEDRAHILQHKKDLIATAKAVDAKASQPDDDEPVTNENF